MFKNILGHKALPYGRAIFYTCPLLRGKESIMKGSKKSLRKALYKHYAEITAYLDTTSYGAWDDEDGIMLTEYEQWQVNFATWLAHATGNMYEKSIPRISSSRFNAKVVELLQRTRYAANNIQ